MATKKTPGPGRVAEKPHCPCLSSIGASLELLVGPVLPLLKLGSHSQEDTSGPESPPRHRGRAGQLWTPRSAGERPGDRADSWHPRPDGDLQWEARDLGAVPGEGGRGDCMSVTSRIVTPFSQRAPRHRQTYLPLRPFPSLEKESSGLREPSS